MRERGDVGRVEPDRPGRRRAVFDMRADACAVTFGAHLIEPIFALALPQRDLDAPAPHAAGQITEKADSAFDRLVFRNPAPPAGSRIGEAAADRAEERRGGKEGGRKG